MCVTENVVILDDDFQFLNLIRAVSEKSGFTVKTYSNPREFLSHQFGPEDLIILDLSMPDIDGIEVLKALSKSHNSSKIVLSTGQDKAVVKATEDLTKAMDLNHVGTFIKPIKISDYKQFLLEITKSQINISPIKNQNKIEPNTINKNSIEQAIYEDQFVPFYQPQYSIDSGKLYGFEVLVRWQHPLYGLIAPSDFIPVAEQNGLIDAITDIVLTKALNDHPHLQQHFQLPITLSVNISALSLNDEHFPEKIATFCKQFQVSPSVVVLEITESALMREITTSLEILARLRMKGFGLSIDDFGTGYSSLSLLHKIPFTELKIDRSFVKDMFNDGDCYAIVETCIVLAKKLNMSVVAEGIETKTILNALKELNCKYGQGYFLGMPSSFENTLHEVKKRH